MSINYTVTVPAYISTLLDAIEHRGDLEFGGALTGMLSIGQLREKHEFSDEVRVFIGSDAIWALYTYDEDYVTGFRLKDGKLEFQDWGIAEFIMKHPGICETDAPRCEQGLTRSLKMIPEAIAIASHFSLRSPYDLVDIAAIDEFLLSGNKWGGWVDSGDEESEPSKPEVITIDYSNPNATTKIPNDPTDKYTVTITRAGPGSHLMANEITITE